MKSVPDEHEKCGRTTLRGPQYKQVHRSHRARIVSPVASLTNLCRNAQGLGQKNSVSK